MHVNHTQQVVFYLCSIIHLYTYVIIDSVHRRGEKEGMKEENYVIIV